MSASSNGLSKSAQIRVRLSHPVIDADGHSTEFEPAVLDYLKDVGGAGVVERDAQRLVAESRAQESVQAAAAAGR